MILMKYEVECIKNIEWVEWYEIVFNGGGGATIFMLLMVIDLIYGTMNETDEDRMWMHQKYGICRIIQNLH